MRALVAYSGVDKGKGGGYLGLCDIFKKTDLGKCLPKKQ